MCTGGLARRAVPNSKGDKVLTFATSGPSPSSTAHQLNLSHLPWSTRATRFPRLFAVRMPLAGSGGYPPKPSITRLNGGFSTPAMACFRRESEAEAAYYRANPLPRIPDGHPQVCTLLTVQQVPIPPRPPKTSHFSVFRTPKSVDPVAVVH